MVKKTTSTLIEGAFFNLEKIYFSKFVDLIDDLLKHKPRMQIASQFIEVSGEFELYQGSSLKPWCFERLITSPSMATKIGKALIKIPSGEDHPLNSQPPVVAQLISPRLAWNSHKTVGQN